MASHSCHRYDKDHALYVGYKPEERTLTCSLSVCIWQARDHCLQDQFLKSCLSKWCGAFSFCSVLSCTSSQLQNWTMHCNCQWHMRHGPSVPNKVDAPVFSAIVSISLRFMCRGMISINLACFSFVKPYHKLQGMEILQDMFQSPAVQSLLQADVQ